MKVFTLLSRIALAAIGLVCVESIQAKDVTLNGFTTVGESKAIQVTYALNSSEKVARVRRVEDISTSLNQNKRKSCVIPQTIKVDGVTYTVKYIGTGAFSHTSDGFEPPTNDKTACKFQRVELPNTITEIGNRAFVGLTDLKYCNIPTSVKLIYPYAFMRTSLESAAIPASCTGIGVSAFQEAALKNLSFADGSNTLEIGAWAFAYNPIITVVTPKRLSKLWHNCFEDCTQMTDVTLNGTLTEIPEFCFSSCSSILRFTVNAPITTIGQNAFSNAMTNVQTFKISTNTLRSIGSFAFYHTGLTTAGPELLKEGMTFIDMGLFKGCSKLTSVVIPTTVTEIDGSAFEDCPNLRRIDCYTPAPPIISYLDTFDKVVYDNADVNVRPELAERFSKADYWDLFNWDKYGLAIDDIAIDNYDSNRPVEYYTLQGVRVDADNLTPGIYIRRHNGRSEKIAIR